MITLDGYSLDYFGLIPRPGHEHSIAPATVERTMNIPGMHGSWDFGATLNARTFLFPLVFARETSRYNLQQKIRAFTAFLLDANGRPRPIKLIFDYEPSVYYMVKFAGGSITPERVLSLGYFDLPLVANDPFSYLIEDVNEIDVNSDILVESDLLIDAVYTFTLTQPAMLNIHNFGTQNIKPTIEVTGTFTNLSIAAESKTLNYTAPLEGENLIIDCADYTVKVEGTNALGNTTGDFITLSPGYIPVSVSGTDLNCTVTFKFKPKFV